MLKAFFDTEKLSVKLGMIFSHIGLSPNAWTVLAIIPAILGFVSLVTYHSLLWGLVFFLASGVIDAIDGAVARVTSRVSAMGAFLDGVIDRYVEFLLYLGLMFFLMDGGPVFLVPSYVWINILLFGAIMPTLIRAYADHRKVVTDQGDLRRMGGLLERAERLALLYVGLLLGIQNILWLVYIVAAAAILANFTAFQRLWFVFRYKAE
ncbi:MAG: CDP-alcohol phosphatidyltransferase family protein [Candidatus Altiarchaeia archaeon]